MLEGMKCLESFWSEKPAEIFLWVAKERVAVRLRGCGSGYGTVLSRVRSDALRETLMRRWRTLQGESELVLARQSGSGG